MTGEDVERIRSYCAWELVGAKAERNTSIFKSTFADSHFVCTNGNPNLGVVGGGKMHIPIASENVLATVALRQ